MNIYTHRCIFNIFIHTPIRKLEIITTDHLEDWRVRPVLSFKTEIWWFHSLSMCLLLMIISYTVLITTQISRPLHVHHVLQPYDHLGDLLLDSLQFANVFFIQNSLSVDTIFQIKLQKRQVEWNNFHLWPDDMLFLVQPSMHMCRI